LNLSAYTDSVIAYAQSHQNTIPYIVFLIGFVKSLAVVSILVPGVIILVAIGAFAAASGLPLAPLVIADGFGAMLGYALSYWVGLYYSDTILHWKIFARHPVAINRSHAFFEKYGTISVFLGHFFGPVRAFIAIIAGVNEMRALPFHIANVTSSFLWAFGVLAPSYYGVSSGFFEMVQKFVKSSF
jgi:membrane protein DedA with SNARE-associated domain